MSFGHCRDPRTASASGERRRRQHHDWRCVVGHELSRLTCSGMGNLNAEWTDGVVHGAEELGRQSRVDSARLYPKDSKRLVAAAVQQPLKRERFCSDRRRIAPRNTSSSLGKEYCHQAGRHPGARRHCPVSDAGIALVHHHPARHSRAGFHVFDVSRHRRGESWRPIPDEDLDSSTARVCDET